MKMEQPRRQDLPPSEWTEDEAMQHLEGTFDCCCRMWPAIMDPYVVQIAEVPADGRKELMRRALRETVLQRYETPPPIEPQPEPATEGVEF